MIGGMDLRRNLRYLINQEFILRNGNQETVKAFCALLAVKYDEIDFSKPLPKKLPTGFGPDIELGSYIACDICGDRLRLSDEEKLIAHNLFRMRLGGDEDVEGQDGRYADRYARKRRYRRTSGRDGREKRKPCGVLRDGPHVGHHLRRERRQRAGMETPVGILCIAPRAFFRPVAGRVDAAFASQCRRSPERTSKNHQRSLYQRETAGR